GQWHPRHDQIVAYLEQLAEASDRVRIEVIGQTHGLRPLQLLTIAAPQRLAEMDSVRADRQRASEAGNGPPVIWLGFAVHGNEASAATAAAVTAWYLAASDDPEVTAWLEDMVIVIEPVLNPDGLDRFAHWVNMHRGRNPSAHPADREHNEAWPNGRTNYYWFDLNRDWLPLVHPESKARMAALQQWRPHVVTDVHEMGPNTTYFFQPGVPERNNPLTPERNYELTRKIAEFHGRILDQANEPYFTRELFDDYYVGKGSTYPDLTGGIGILFEQASVRGHVQDTVFGTRHFEQAVANQVRTSLSTLQASQALSAELIDYQREFFASALEQARSDRRAGWVLGDGGDPARARRLVELLLAHGIEMRQLTEPVTIAGVLYETEAAWFIPASQVQYRLLRSILDPVTELPMETFYDVSTWPLAMSHGLPVDSVRRAPALGERMTRVPPSTWLRPDPGALAWLVPWDQHAAPGLLADLLQAGYRVQASVDPLRIADINGEGERSLSRGSLVIHRGLQPDELAPVAELLHERADRRGVDVVSAGSGLALSGPDLGSPSVPVLESMRPAMLVGSGLRATHAGYIWHWFDTVLDMPLVQLEHDRLWRVDLDDFTHIILPDGNYEVLAPDMSDRLAAFVRNGGTLIAARSAAVWVENLPLDWSFVDEANDKDSGNETPARRPYGEFQADFARRLIGGSALNVILDPSHPLAFGYEQPEQVVFRRGRHKLREVNNPYVNAGIYSEEILASGYLAPDTIERLAGSPALSATHHGRGLVIRMADDYLFRGYWAGSERLFANALFFGQLVRRTELPAD
ncbi:MAG: hypothetical protein EA370_16290, partial [Wenzhouxiangella sp.]